MSQAALKSNSAVSNHAQVKAEQAAAFEAYQAAKRVADRDAATHDEDYEEDSSEDSADWIPTASATGSGSREDPITL